MNRKNILNKKISFFSYDTVCIEWFLTVNSLLFKKLFLLVTTSYLASLAETIHFKTILNIIKYLHENLINLLLVNANSFLKSLVSEDISGWVGGVFSRASGIWIFKSKWLFFTLGLRLTVEVKGFTFYVILCAFRKLYLSNLLQIKNLQIPK